jgi:PhnB protein
MAQLNPYLHFNGNCAEAMKFYHACLGGDLTVLTVGDSQMAATTPKEALNNVMHSTLIKDGFTLMASDMMESDQGVQGNTVTLCMVCNSKQEIESLFSSLSAGGKVGHPLKEEFFGTFGDLTDKYGFNWMFQMDAPKP